MAAEVKPLLFVGNRRSGTTIMCHILNRHPDVYVNFERYALWILYQMVEEDRLDGFRKYPTLVPEPMWITMGTAWKEIVSLISSQPVTYDEARDGFFSIMYSCMRKRVDGKDKNPKLIGEKNPEIANEPMRSFVHKVLPDAKYIHMVRHPMNCIKSKLDFARRVPRTQLSWRLSDEELLKDWVETERGALQVENKITVRLEDLSRCSGKEMDRVYSFLGVPNIQNYRDIVKKSKVKNYKRPDVHVDGLVELMKEYGYE